MIGVLLPAHNEAARIDRCLRSVLRAARHPALNGEPVHVVVALDDCSDATAALCAQRGVDTVAVAARCVGAARAAAAARVLALGARWLACTDADGEVPRNWLAAQLAGPHDVFCGVVDLLAGSARERALKQRFRQQERWGDGHGRVHGANLGVASHAYRRVGGFASLRTGEDVDLVQRLQGSGARVQWAGWPPVMTSARLQGRAPAGFAALLSELAPEVAPLCARLPAFG